MNSILIVEKFKRWRDDAAEIALVTVFETAGSTYSKPGHRILIASGGDYQGLVSGGCLEGDLAEHAAQAIESKAARVVTYDLRDDADELFGLGIGCDGLIRVLVQPVSPAEAYAPFTAIAEAMLGPAPVAVATVVASTAADVRAGATLLVGGDEPDAYAVPGRLRGPMSAACEAALADGETRLVEIDSGTRALVGPLSRVPRLLVLGAGIDAVPLVSMAGQLGWRVHVADHRPAYLERSAFAMAAGSDVVLPGRLRATLALDDFDAIVVMSHHLATDEAYLRELTGVRCRYVGVLGPPARRAKLLAALGDAGAALADVLRGPVGLDLGADTPETIALSILAEIQLALGGRRTPAIR